MEIWPFDWNWYEDFWAQESDQDEVNILKLNSQPNN